MSGRIKIGGRFVDGGNIIPVVIWGNYPEGSGMDVSVVSPIDPSSGRVLVDGDPWMLDVPGEHKFGLNPDIDTGDTPVEVWDGPKGGYTGWIAAAAACEISSDDPNDDDGDTGAWTVKVTGLDTNGLLQTFTATMNGAGAVAIGTFYRIFRMEVLTAGTTGTNEGTITAETTVGGDVMAVITPGNGQTLMAIYTIPDDYDHSRMLNIFCQMNHDGTNNRAGAVQLRARAVGANGPNASWAVKETMELYNRAGPLFHPLYHAPTYEPLTDLALVCTVVTGNNSVVSGGFDLKHVSA